MRTRTLFLVSLIAMAGCSSPSKHPLIDTHASVTETEGGYAVDIDPASFVERIDNAYMPLLPGSRWRLEGVTDEGREVDVITVTDRTKVVMGVSTTVVKDVVSLEGEPVEKTLDWFAQDVDGNVWYFGESTAGFEDGRKVGTDGSWQAGVDGAVPGIVMPADPRISDAFRQEYLPGEAEDMFWIVETGKTKSVPSASYEDVVHVLEWSPLEPSVVGEKYYAPGVGLIWERSLAGGKERFELVSYRAARST